MDRKEVLRLTEAHAKEVLSKGEPGHDWWHTRRVWQTALKIAKHKKEADLFVVQLGALLHDIADWKFHKKGSKTEKALIRDWLNKMGAEKDTIDKVSYVVEAVTFKGAKAKDEVSSIEAAIVQDADRLDALGAIGVARAFGYGGYKMRPMYDPAEKIHYHRSFRSYKTAQSKSTVNHFYEKLLLLRSRMKTKEGQRIAKERDTFCNDISPQKPSVAVLVFMAHLRKVLILGQVYTIHIVLPLAANAAIGKFFKVKDR